ncbi:MAG TPA: 30S ribosomal protein S3 [Thermoplasmata archaeon]|jgi:small subunit ribosomal protein S3|nr:30S ribosomal protein S3 [Thermoplasmata archaeon]HIH28852.1 30S ribosomal protein S3 [Thermoplasmata archaeon]
MANERKFIRENAKRSLIKKFLVKEIEGAGFGGMSIQRTPIGTRVNILVERPGMVIGKSGSKIKELTDSIRTKFNVDNPQIEIQEAGSNASLNAQIMAEKLAEALERGWHFRRAGHSTVRRIMQSGAKGCQVILAGKLTGERHRTEKFTEGHVKYCGETAKEVMDIGLATAKLKPGVLGVKVRIMRPDAKLPDEITYKLAVKEEVKPEIKIEAKPVELKLEKKTDISNITKIPGIGPSVLKKLDKAKITSLEELYAMNLDDLIAIDGIGNKTAELIVKNIKKLLEEGTENGSQS